MITNLALLRRPTAQTSGKIAISLRDWIWQRKERKENLYLILPWRRRRRGGKDCGLCAQWTRVERSEGKMCWLIKWERWKRSSTFGILGSLNIVLITAYVGLHPISNTKTPTVILLDFHRDQLGHHNSMQHQSLLKAIHFKSLLIFFSSVSWVLFYLHGNDKTLSPANQSRCDTNQNNVCNITSFDRCTMLSDTFLCLFYVILVWRHCQHTLVFRV